MITFMELLRLPNILSRYLVVKGFPFLCLAFIFIMARLNRFVYASWGSLEAFRDGMVGQGSDWRYDAIDTIPFQPMALDLASRLVRVALMTNLTL